MTDAELRRSAAGSTGHGDGSDDGTGLASPDEAAEEPEGTRWAHADALAGALVRYLAALGFGWVAGRLWERGL